MTGVYDWAQVVDESSGPATKREYRIATVPAGDALAGATVDFLGRVPGSYQVSPSSASAARELPYICHVLQERVLGACRPVSVQDCQLHAWRLQTCCHSVERAQAVGQDAQVPLFNAQLDMDSREQINEALTTGVKVCAMLHITMRTWLALPGL